MTQQQKFFPRLTIEHNHGTLILADAFLDDRGLVTGTVLGGGEMSRLFHATSYRLFPVGQQMSYPLWGRIPYPQWSIGRAEGGKWVEHPTPGSFRVSCVTCG